MQASEARRQYSRWLLATRDLSPHTIRAYDSDIAAFERHLGAHTVVEFVDSDCVVAFIEAQQLAGLSPMSVRRRASAVRGFCRWLVSQGVIDSDPWSEASVTIGRSRKLPRILSTHDLDRLIGFLRKTAGIKDEDDPALTPERLHEATTLLAVSLMVATGVRVHEAVGIRYHDIDLHSRSLRLLGKGRRERQVFLTNDWITGLTRAYLDVRLDLNLRHQYLFFNLNHDPLTPPAMRSRLAKAARAAGLPGQVTPHMLRHTAATQLIEAGVDIRYIQRLLGHASLSTTEIYTHVSDLALKQVVSEADVLGRLAHS